MHPADLHDDDNYLSSSTRIDPTNMRDYYYSSITVGSSESPYGLLSSFAMNPVHLPSLLFSVTCLIDQLQLYPSPFTIHYVQDLLSAFVATPLS